MESLPSYKSEGLAKMTSLKNSYFCKGTLKSSKVVYTSRLVFFDLVFPYLISNKILFICDAKCMRGFEDEITNNEQNERLYDMESIL
jgi:hypothetical protein